MVEVPRIAQVRVLIKVVAVGEREVVHAVAQGRLAREKRWQAFQGEGAVARTGDAVAGIVLDAGCAAIGRAGVPTPDRGVLRAGSHHADPVGGTGRHIEGRGQGGAVGVKRDLVGRRIVEGIKRNSAQRGLRARRDRQGLRVDHGRGRAQALGLQHRQAPRPGRHRR